MSLPIRHLPLVQNWECQNCGNCCHEYHISVTDEERRRIESQGWASDPKIGGRRLFVRFGPLWSRKYRLNHREDGACVFLNADNRCMLHERFGAAAKPFPCRLYPFVLVPAGDHWRIGLRYACPSAAENQGVRLNNYIHELGNYTNEIEQQAGTKAEQIPPPALQRGQSLPWPDLHRFVQALIKLLQNQDDRFERRMRKCLALAHLCRQAQFDRIRGGRLTEFVNLVISGLDDEVPVDPSGLPRPSGIARVLFRQVLAVYPRKDYGPNRNMVRTRAGLFAAACRFALGIGSVPRLHAWIPETTFEQVENTRTELSLETEQSLERYFTLKLASFQFCGSAHFGFSFWEGFFGLALVLPVILWLVRSMQPLTSDVAVIRAISMVDRNFGFNPVLRLRRQRMALAILVRGGDLERLIAWYSR